MQHLIVCLTRSIIVIDLEYKGEWRRQRTENIFVNQSINQGTVPGSWHTGSHNVFVPSNLEGLGSVHVASFRLPSPTNLGI